MSIKQIPANAENYGKKRDVGTIRYIVVHYTANKGDKAVNNGEYFRKYITKSSAHYFVDEKETVQSVADNYIAYSVGGSKYKNTGGGSLYGKCTNANSISVELCDSYYGVPEKTAERAIELICELMDRYNVPAKNVIRHYDVTGKLCPRAFAKDGSLWREFKEKLGGKDMEELKKEIADLEHRISVLEKEAAVYDYIDENMPKWIQEISVWGLSKNILSGTGAGLGMTKAKAEALVMIKRALEG